jgi:hypothetical protein
MTNKRKLNRMKILSKIKNRMELKNWVGASIFMTNIPLLFNEINSDRNK